MRGKTEQQVTMLVALTPASGYIGPLAAVIIGFGAPASFATWLANCGPG